MVGIMVADLGSGDVDGRWKSTCCDRLDGVTGVDSPESVIPSIGDDTGDEGSLWKACCRLTDRVGRE